MTWYQVAYDQNADHGKRWVVMQFVATPAGPQSFSPIGIVISRWPTKHEAEGHARKAVEQFR